MQVDKKLIVDQTFLDNQAKLHKELEKFLHDKTSFLPYHEKMKELDSWIKKGQEHENS